ncbi:trihelix transcription factor GTL1-like [Telopea speciosissima]|uniref:trihelix transcription factor GTL1-like n=1 Tax=Telopea speciosissima TaxID=54955 RepID=UPI001CC4D42A|nr:trihelix transcription factor GTL1-like [Telopea speciosissima]
MFNGIPDQFYQFIDSRTTPLTLPFSLPLHISPSSFSPLDPPPSHPQHQQHQQQQQQLFFQSHHPLLHHHHLHRQSPTVQDDDDEEEEEEEEEEQEEEREEMGRTNMEVHVLNLKPTSQLADPWTEEEILALWRVRSSIESGFTDFLWEHISRKLAEVGFKRSAEKCKEKYDEVSKYFNNNNDNTGYSKNYKSFNELEALYEGAKNPNPTTSAKKVVMSDKGGSKLKFDSEENSGNETLVNPTVEKDCVIRNSRKKKRKRYQKFKLIKRFCEEIVNKIMVQQEELQNKLLQDMERKEEERMVREETWRRQEMARMDKEIELRAREQAIACDRETTIIEFLKNLGSCPSQFQAKKIPPNQVLNSPPLNPLQNPNPVEVASASSTPDLTSQNPESLPNQENPIPQNPNYTSSDKEDHGKRWPRNEVYSLINLRCNLHSSGEDKEGSKIPLWERISKGMLELGYKRSAKRCKEKWENINKYFRKTRDANKKRSLDSKTCPYFHQLSSLYNQGKLVLTSEGPENHSSSPENRSESPVAHFRSPENGLDDEGKKNLAQVPASDFEY